MKKIKGRIKLPGDKSISHRSAMFSALSSAKARFTNFNFNQDCTSTLSCLRTMGIDFDAEMSKNKLSITGKSLKNWNKPQQDLNAGNSGTTARLISGILCNAPFSSKLTGDQSLSNRPMKRVIDPLCQMGAVIESDNYKLPLVFHHVRKTNGIRYILPVASAQVKSAILLSGLFAEGITEIVENKITRDHTERMLGLKTRNNSDGSKSVFSSWEVEIPDLSMNIPGDFSSGAFFITAALILPDSELQINDVSLNPTRTGLLDILKMMGAEIEVIEKQAWPEPCGNINIKYKKLKNMEIPVNLVPNIIDEIPALSILATQSEGKFILHGAEELRHKESDRIQTIIKNLARIGVKTEEYDDGFSLIGPQKIKSGKIETCGDHRIAMAFGIASVITDKKIQIDDPDCASVSFPNFWPVLTGLIK